MTKLPDGETTASWGAAFSPSLRVAEPGVRSLGPPARSSAANARGDLTGADPGAGGGGGGGGGGGAPEAAGGGGAGGGGGGGGAGAAGAFEGAPTEVIEVAAVVPLALLRDAVLLASLSDSAGGCLGLDSSSPSSSVSVSSALLALI